MYNLIDNFLGDNICVSYNRSCPFIFIVLLMVLSISIDGVIGPIESGSIELPKLIKATRTILK